MTILARNENFNALYDFGPIVDVEVYQTPLVPVSQMKGMKLPPPFVGKFLIDTGARSTCIKPHIASKLGLKQVGVTGLETPNRVSDDHPVYVAGLRIVADKAQISFDVLRVVEVSLKGQNIDGLIGRDILLSKLFIYTGFTGSFLLAV